MPNNTRNIVDIRGPEYDMEIFVARVIHEQDDEVIFDFNAIVPMPEKLKIEECSMGIDAYYLFYVHDG